MKNCIYRVKEKIMGLLMANRLSREYINSLPIIRFEGDVKIIDKPEDVDDALDYLEGFAKIGFDTESRPSFTRGKSYPISLLQLASNDIAYLFQLKKTGFPDRLTAFLENQNIKKIGVGIKNDIEKLKELKPFEEGGFVDLSKIAAEKGIIQVGLRGLTARYMEQRITKTAQKTNWAQSRLTRKQKVYAASDAWICLLIYPRLLADKTNYRKFLEEEEKARKTEQAKKEAEKKAKALKNPKPVRQSLKSHHVRGHNELA